MSEEHDHTHTQRDGETFIILGIFMAVLGLPVILGSFWGEKAVQVVVCLVSGILLLGIGVGFLLHGKNVLKRLH